MSGDGQTQLHDALVKAIRDAVKPVKVYDHVPQDAEFPYITLGEGDVTEWDTSTELGQEHRPMIHVWYRPGSSGTRVLGKQPVRDLLKQIYDALHDQDLPLAAGAALVFLYFEFSSIDLDPDGQTYHGVARYRATTTEA